MHLVKLFPLDFSSTHDNHYFRVSLISYYLLLRTNWRNSSHIQLQNIFFFLMNHRLGETHIFSFVVGRAFVTDIEKLKISSKTRSLDVDKLLRFFSEVTKVCLLNAFTKILSFPLSPWRFLVSSYILHAFMQDGINTGSNLLTAVEVLVSGVILFP